MSGTGSRVDRRLLLLALRQGLFLVNNVTLLAVTPDPAIAQYPVRTLW